MDGHITMAYTVQSIPRAVEILLHLSYNKNGISGSFTFHKAKLHVIYLNLLSKSVFKDPYHYFHGMFQQFNPSLRLGHHPLGHLSLYKLVEPHLTSNLLECNLPSQSSFISPIPLSSNISFVISSFITGAFLEVCQGITVCTEVG